MKEPNDPLIASLFELATEELTDKQFTERLMARIQRRRRFVLMGRLGIVGLAVLLELLFQAPLQSTVAAATQLLGMTLLELENVWVAAAFAPLNSLAGLFGILFLVMHCLYRRSSSWSKIEPRQYSMR